MGRPEAGARRRRAARARSARRRAPARRAGCRGRGRSRRRPPRRRRLAPRPRPPMPAGAYRTALSTRLATARRTVGSSTRADAPPAGRRRRQRDVPARRPSTAALRRPRRGRRRPGRPAAGRWCGPGPARRPAVRRSCACSRRGRRAGPLQPPPVDLEGRLRVGEQHLGVGHQHRQRRAQLVAGLLDQPPLGLGGVLQPVEHGVEARGQRDHLGGPRGRGRCAGSGPSPRCPRRPRAPGRSAAPPAGPPPGQPGGDRGEREDRRRSSTPTARASVGGRPPTPSRVSTTLVLGRHVTPNSSSTGT